jgi:hypothetical protein
VKKNFSLPIKYEQQEFTDERFLKLKIYVMHDGVNLNNSNFSMDAIESAKNSIKNIPILAFVKELDGEDQKDFAGHEMEMIFKNDEFSFKYLGRPIGVIPADTNNYRYEVIEDKTYVVVDGYVWKDYANDALDILERDEMKSQSMEITIDSCSFTDDGICDISNYKYTGVCLLGDDVIPAMEMARAEVATQQVFNKNKFKETISDMLMELKFSMNEESVEHNFELEGGKEMNKEQEFESKQEDSPKEEMSTEEDVPMDKDMMASDSEQKDEEPDGDEDGKDTDNDGDGSVDYQTEYESLKAKYEILETELNSFKEKFTSVENELTELRTYKAEKLAEERTGAESEIFEKFSEELTEDEMKTIKEKSSEYSLEDLEEKLFALAGRKKVKFSAKPKNERIKMGVFEIKEDSHIEKDIWTEQKEKFGSNK